MSLTCLSRHPPPIHQVKAESFSIILRRKIVRTIKENKSTTLYVCHIFLKHLPHPLPYKRLSPSSKGPAAAFLQVDNSYNTRRGGRTHAGGSPAHCQRRVAVATAASLHGSVQDIALDMQFNTQSRKHPLGQRAKEMPNRINKGCSSLQVCVETC